MTNTLTRKFALGTIGLAVLAVAIITMSSVGQSEGKASDLGYAQELAELYQETNTLNSVSSRPVTGSVDRRVDTPASDHDVMVAQTVGEPVDFGDDPYIFVDQSLHSGSPITSVVGEISIDNTPTDYDINVARFLGEPVDFGDDPYRFVNPPARTSPFTGSESPVDPPVVAIWADEVGVHMADRPSGGPIVEKPISGSGSPVDPLVVAIWADEVGVHMAERPSGSPIVEKPVSGSGSPVDPLVVAIWADEVAVHVAERESTGRIIKRSMFGNDSMVSASLSMPDVLVMASSKGGLYAATMSGEKLWKCGDGPCDI